MKLPFFQNYDFIIIPGIGNSDEKHWQSKWENFFSNAHRIVVSNWDEPDRKEWETALGDLLGGLENGRKKVLIAHSLGCLLVHHYFFENQIHQNHVAAILLVAPPNPKSSAFPAQAAGFSNLTRIKLVPPALILASENDPYAEIDFSKQLASDWGAEFKSIGKKGHVNSQSNLGKWLGGVTRLFLFLWRL
ncbi:RBBP9/YdeN family alpha/beta hydrolase [Leptospira sp. 'Mane']|uniref:RBBP9/YdeN family alpha/beta hydrolase n=1 Tax=Leptospira sp. 'Mane' TaxID=3387407 RepID=UPI00398BA291